MDLLYSRYSNPMDLIALYINQGRFGTFVSGFLEAEQKRKQEEQDKFDDMRLWIAYVHSHAEISFDAWKNSLAQKSGANKPNAKRNGDLELDERGMESIINNLFKVNSSNGGEGM